MPATKTLETTEIEFTPPVAEAMVPVLRTEAAATIQPLEPATILQVIARVASDPASDIEKMERLIAMQERMESRQAQVEYDNAMSDAQEAMKPIRANLENPQTRSEYADYSALDKVVRPIYARHGFSLSFDTGDGAPENHVRIICTVAHRSGHRERPRLDMPADGKGARGNDVMTKTHATGAAITYGKRYLLGMIFNLAVTRDDDGNEASGEDSDIEGNAPPDALRDREGKLLSHYASDKAKTFAARAIESINLSANAQAVKDWRRENFKAPKGSNVSPLAWLEYHAPSEFNRVKMAYENVTGEGW